MRILACILLLAVCGCKPKASDDILFAIDGVKLETGATVKLVLSEDANKRFYFAGAKAGRSIISTDRPINASDSQRFLEIDVMDGKENDTITVLIRSR